MRDWSASTLAERLDHLKAIKQAPKEGEKPTQNAFARQLGLESATYARLRQRGEDVRFGGEVSTLYQIATKTGVSFAWLAIGDGQPEDTLAPGGEQLTDPWPNRATAIKFALDGGVDPLAVELLLSERPPHGYDPPVLWWIERMQLKAIQALRSERHDGPPASTATRKRAL